MLHFTTMPITACFILLQHASFYCNTLKTAHSWANAGVVLGDACIGTGVAFEATIGMKLVREKLKLINLIVNHAQYGGV